MSNMDDYINQFEGCLQKEEPACTNVCPFHLNVLDFQDKIKRHKYDRAYRSYKNAVCFPEIVAALCPEYCHDVCPRKEYDGAVQLNLLERTCVTRAEKKDPTSYNVPHKKGKIGIVGGGISGLACAIKLLEKKYEVIIFEKEDKIGGQLESLLPEDIYLSDIERQFSKEEYELKLNTEIKSLDTLNEFEFNCIYIATGYGGNDFYTLESENGYCYMKDEVAVFGGGSLTGKDAVKSIADGIKMAWAIEVFLKTGTQEYPMLRQKTKVVADIKEFSPCPPVDINKNSILSDKETEVEAGRCIRCQCNACWSECDIVAFHDKWPMGIREDINMTVVSTESMIHKTPAIRLINTCTQCGLYEESCPPHIAMGDMILESRKLLHKQGKMPPAFHGFWLDDMEHANSNLVKLNMNSPGETTSEYAFFPGCHLGATDPRYVEATYKWLNDNFNKMGILVRCCGVPADWAGNEDMHKDQIESLKEDWMKLGKPALVVACPSCKKHIYKYLPEIDTVSVYELMGKKGKWPDSEFKIQDEFAIFDPCSARNDNAFKNSVRKAIATTDIKIAEFSNKTRYGCCGFGGNVEIANPDFADYVAARRVDISDKPYLTYCINCRDVFIGEKKPTLHVLDVLFDLNGFDIELPSLTKRRSNRLRLKESLLRDCWGKQMDKLECKYDFEIVLHDKLREKMDSLKLVDDDICRVIETSNNFNRRTFDKENDEYICYAKLNYITCWVRYKKEENVYHIKNVYTHRMNIKLEAVWNGKKTDAYM